MSRLTYSGATLQSASSALTHIPFFVRPSAILSNGDFKRCIRAGCSIKRRSEYSRGRRTSKWLEAENDLDQDVNFVSTQSKRKSEYGTSEPGLGFRFNGMRKTG
jgi:hypothetical protein